MAVQKVAANGRAQFVLQHNTETHDSMEGIHQYVKGLQRKITMHQ